MPFRPSAQSIVIDLSLTSPSGTLNLNDGTAYAVAGDSTREQVAVSYNQVTATNPTMAGQYLVHSVPQMVSETVKIWVYGTSQVQVQQRYQALKTAFENWAYQLHWTFADYSETWNCNAVTQLNSEMGASMLHNYMAAVTLTVPRFPAVLTP